MSSKRVVDRALVNPADLGDGMGIVTDFPESPEPLGDIVARIVARLR
jgi:hypothetical protein